MYVAFLFKFYEDMTKHVRKAEKLVAEPKELIRIITDKLGVQK
jgi:hypothetical protein